MAASRSVRSRWNRTLAMLFSLIALVAVGSFVGSSFMLGSLRDSARDFERDSGRLAELQRDEATYAGFVHRYMDGEVDPFRDVARTAVQRAFELALADMSNPAGRRLLQQAYDSWRTNDANRRPLDRSTSSATRLAGHAAVTAEDASTLQLAEQAAAISRAEFRDRLGAAEETNRWRAVVFVVTSVLTLGLMTSLARRLSTEVLRPLEALDEGARHLAAGDLDHRVLLDTRDELGHVAQAFNTMADAIASTQQALVTQSLHDPLTGLNNRRAFDRSLADVLDVPGRRSGNVALLFADLDGFKAVNDTFGHAVGDEVLRVVGGRLLASVRPGDLAARVGGDEFAVLLKPVAGSGPEEAIEVAQRLLGALSAPILVSGHAVRVGVSIGVAIGRDGSDSQELLREADSAMYQAKSRGHNQIVLSTDRGLTPVT